MAEPEAGTSALVDLINAIPDIAGTWGPPVTSETLLNGVPYAPFSKSDKLGRMADWTDAKDGRDGRGGKQYNRGFRDQQVYGAGSASLFAPPVAEDEASFSVVSNVRDTTKTRFGRGAVFTRGGRGNARGGRGDARSGGRQQFQRTGRGGAQFGGGYDSRGGARGGAARGGRRFGWKDYDKPARNRDASINIKADWQLLEEIDFNRLGKLNLDADEGEDIDSYGFVNYYDRSYDKPPVKNAERKLTPVDRAAYNVTTSVDPVIQELADKDEATIFATDSVLSMLMCAPRSVYSWDIVINRVGNKVFLDKRDNATLDLVTVNENAADAPLEASEGSKDSINQPGALAEEATYINHNFANQVVLENQKVDMAKENPFYSAEEKVPAASKGYKYRRFDLSTSDEDPMYLVVRTEVDAVQRNAINGDDQFITVHALNEFDSKAQGSGGALDWRTKLVSQRGAVVATEMKNNSCKLARWTVQSILAKADVMKLGFVSRVNPKSNDKHVILGVVGWKPKDFANQMNLQLSNGWGIVRTIADMCLHQEEGKFILVKDPNKNILRLYALPAGSLDEDDEEPETTTTTPRKITPKKTPLINKTKAKTKPRPNASILNYFKKAADETLFIGGEGGGGRVNADDEILEEVEEDIYAASGDEAEGDEESVTPVAVVEKRRLSGDEGCLKRRKLSSSSSNPTSESTTLRDKGAVVNNRRKKTANPFLDDSSDEDGEEEEEDIIKGKKSEEEDDEDWPARVRNNALFEETVKDDPDSKLTNWDNIRIIQARPPQKSRVPLLRHETSGARAATAEQEEEEEAETKPDDDEDEIKDKDEFDFPDRFDEEYDEDFTGEELEAMRAMEEQARLEVEEYLEEDNCGENSCPVCGGSLNEITESAATAHVNSCLDGNPTPLPAPPPPPPRAKETQLRKGFASKAAVARPGQSNPFILEDGGDGGGSGGASAFAKLMSGHAEDSAWVTAASAEQASRGMPAYKRTCPFYKIMPGFSICVDAFRYGAVEGCKAYFLSHFHSDHYMGLSATWTYGPIYCSKVTGSLVKSQLKTAAKFVVELEFEQTVPVPDIQGVTVTMIPANHCPGSSLFLFEKVTGGKTQRILHCGDFRACPAHVEHPQLRPETVDAISGKTRQQKIDVCYLDTTYLNPRYSFPPQSDVIRSCAEICALLNKGLVANDTSEWDSLLRRREGGAPKGVSNVSKFFSTSFSSDKPTPGNPGPGGSPPPPDAFTAIRPETRRNRLLVVCGTYSIGKERICVAIAQALKTKIFANPAKIRMCKQLDDPELSALMTSDPREAQVHMQMLMELRADTLAEYLEAHRSNGFTKVIGFRPSGWNYRPSNGAKNAPANLAPGSLPTTQILHGPNWRTEFRVKDILPQRGATREAMCFGVPYSEHSSFRELAMFLMALRVEKVVPTVNVGSEASRKRMKGWIDKWLAERRKGGLVRALKEGEKEMVKLWEVHKGDGVGKGGGVHW
ncbi:hypothetical protein QBC43DRAFT_249931 [Cladorrhinum sp. PSN259]|nr:hypothetical protein QBC43DRAFT_249931 [Cladorrhinum sp. PSN259]